MYPTHNSMTGAILDQYRLLLPKLGPFPTLWRVSCFLGEPVLSTWRRIELGELKTVHGTKVVRIKLESLAEVLAGRPRKSKKDKEVAQ